MFRLFKKKIINKPLVFFCEHYHEDGCGHYCKACIIPKELINYPHKYLRVHCFGIKDSLTCKNLLKKHSKGAN
jgi:hypothetical protein